MGDVVISLVLKKYGCIPELRPSPTRVLVTVFSPEMASQSVRVAADLRRAGIETELYPTAIKMAKQFRYADQLGIPFAVVVGPDEAAQDRVALKDLSSGEQQILSIEDAIARLTS